MNKALDIVFERMEMLEKAVKQYKTENKIMLAALEKINNTSDVDHSYAMGTMHLLAEEAIAKVSKDKK